MIRAFWNSRATRSALALAAAAAIYTVGVLMLNVEAIGIEFPITEAALVLAASFLLGMRLHLAYDRWWEARKLWGTLVNSSRNLAVKISSFVRPDVDEAREVAAGIAGFAFALKDHLRNGTSLRTVEGFEGRTENPEHVPVWLVGRLYDKLHEWRETGRVVPEEVRVIDADARVLLEVCGACERIRNTLMPPSIAVLTRIILMLALLLLPMILIPRVGWLSVLGAFVVTFFGVIVETTAATVERPFGTDSNQLDLDRLCMVIRDTTREALLGPR